VTILHVAASEITDFLDSGSRITDELKSAVREKMASGKPAGKDDQVRISFSPLYFSFEDVYMTAQNLEQLLGD